jgi:hypothetical protein
MAKAFVLCSKSCIIPQYVILSLVVDSWTIPTLPSAFVHNAVHGDPRDFVHQMRKLQDIQRWLCAHKIRLCRIRLVVEVELRILAFVVRVIVLTS